MTGQHSSSSPLSALDSPLSSLPHSDFRIPISSSSPPSALRSELDALFARLDDDDAAARTGDLFDEDDRDEQPDHEREDGLDVWSVLYGLD